MSVLAAIRAPARRSAVATAPRAGMRSSMHMKRSIRKYSTESAPNPPPKPKSNVWLYGSITGAALISAGYYLYSTSDAKNKAATAAKSAGQAAKVKANFVPTKEDYQKVYNEIAEILEDNDYDDGSYGPVIARLAWHTSGTYDKDTKTGGSNYATMRFEPEALHSANAGLNVARERLEKVKEKFPWISYGDLWTLGGVCAVQEMGGPKVPWRPGRIDGTSKECTPDGRLPDASQGSDHVRNVFYRMGFNDQEIVALIGCHALGRAHTDRSGYDGPWTFSPITFANEFFKLLLDEKWVWRKWSGPKQLQDKKTGTLMMLPTDYVLVQDKNFKKYVKQYAEDQDLFFNDFSKAFAKLLELGVPEQQWVTPEPWTMKSTDE